MAIIALVATLAGPITPLSAAAQARVAPSPGSGRLLVSLLVDTSGSMRGQDLILVRHLTADLLSRLPAGSQVAVYSFDDLPHQLQTWTEDQPALDRVLAGLAPGGRYTAFYDAVYQAVSDLSRQAAGARAIVVITDGRDEKSDVKLTDATDAAKAAGVPIYTVGMGKQHLGVLHRMAALSFGAYLSGDADSGRELASRLASPSGSARAGEAGPNGAKPVHSTGQLTAAGSTTALAASAARSNGGRRLAWWWAALALLVVAVLGGVLLASRRPHPPAPPPPAPGRLADAPLRAPASTPDAPPGDATVVRSGGLSAAVLNRTELIVLGDGTLVIKDGDGNGQVFKIARKADTLVGRSPLADIRLPDTTVSHEHCRISARRGFFLLQDLNSTNGTFVNGERVREHVLKDGDAVKLGETVLEFREMR